VSRFTRFNHAGIINEDQWHHVVMRYDGSASSGRLKVYVDNQLMYLTTHGAGGSPTISADMSGSDLMIGNLFDGKLDNLRIYNRALNETEIGNLYNETNDGCTFVCIYDNDGDGYFSDVDFNDSDADVYPGAPDICDLKDNDGDGLVDINESVANGLVAHYSFNGDAVDSLGVYDGSFIDVKDAVGHLGGDDMYFKMLLS